ncbi:NADH:flavin oxidoreductase [Halioxenophilus sp. WMMB6]|uniref:NADH:flavin oxidoreductase n=1 Tax=Halioxenophilus sp. WMMB6 TaxID=3073815 RepID=UPI00295EE561|nr:NADH:flavin oxidoreductase [Halioxenophilus sp. WMMB6]
MPSVDCLFQPFHYHHLTLANRIVMAPMTRSFSPGNVPSVQVADYYRRRAAGGVGLIITEGTCIDHPAAHGYDNVPSFYGEAALAGWQRVVDAVHAEGGKIAPQLWHVGAVRRAGVNPGGDTPGYSPSGMAMPGKVTGHAMSQDDIDAVVAAFAEAAVNAKQLGFDAVEIHAAHGYLIDQFFWRELNQRSDRYGGDMRGRAQFAVEIISAIRRLVGPEFPIILRWSQWKQQDYSARLAETSAELEAFLQPLCEAGVDIFHCSQRRFWQPEFEGSSLNLAGWVKHLTGRPTITVGSVGLNDDFLQEGSTDFKAADTAAIDGLLERLAAGEFDLVALGRALLANPDWPQRIRQGDFEQLHAYDKSLLTSLD